MASQQVSTSVHLLTPRAGRAWDVARFARIWHLPDSYLDWVYDRLKSEVDRSATAQSFLQGSPGREASEDDQRKSNDIYGRDMSPMPGNYPHCFAVQSITVQKGASPTECIPLLEKDGDISPLSLTPSAWDRPGIW